MPDRNKNIMERLDRLESQIVEVLSLLEKKESKQDMDSAKAKFKVVTQGYDWEKDKENQ